MKIAIALITAASLSLAGFAAQAEDFTLDLSKVNPATAHGQAAIKLWKAQVADAYCGPVEMAQPLELYSVRAKCQAAVNADSQARLDKALARQQAMVRTRVETRG
jgi:UrcA family protein